MKITSIALFIAAVGLIGLLGRSRAVVGDPDLPGFVPKIENMTECSIIIPMDLEYQGDSCNCYTAAQTFNGTATNDFNLRAYGLVVALLWADVPVKWVIKTGKAHGDPDVVVQAQMLFPNNRTTQAPITMALKGGPFFVPIYWTEKAIPVIRNYTNSPQPRGAVAVYRLAQTVQVDVRYFLTSRPYVAVLDSSSLNTILTATLQAAGMIRNQSFTIMSKAQAVALSQSDCITMAMEPHFHASDDAACTGPGYPQQFVAAMRNFTAGGGNFLAECGGIATYEQCDEDRNGTIANTCSGSITGSQNREAQPTDAQRAICPSGYFASDKGLRLRYSGDVRSSTYANCAAQSTSNSAILPVNNLAADTPYGQWTGGWFYEYLSSVMSMSLWTRSSVAGYDGTGTGTYNTSLRAENGAHWVVQDSTCTQRLEPDRGAYFALHSKLQAFHGRKGGNVFYLAGHDYGLQSHQIGGASCITESGTSGAGNVCYNKPGRRMIMNAVLTPANRSNCSVSVEITPGVFIDVALDITLDLGQAFYKKRGTDEIYSDLSLSGIAQTNATNISSGGAPPYPCNCLQRLDRCAVCGGNGQSCVIYQTIQIGGGFPTVAPSGVPVTVISLLTPAILNSTGITTGTYSGNGPASYAPLPSFQTTGTTSTGGTGQVPTTQAATPSAPVPSATSTSTGTPAGPTDPLASSANKTTAVTGVVTLMPGETRAYLIECGLNVADMDIYVSLLSPVGAVSIQIAKNAAPGGPSPTNNYCNFILTPTMVSSDGAPGVDHFTWSTDKTDAGCNFPLSGATLDGSWYVTITATGTTAASVTVEATLTGLPAGSGVTPPGGSASSLAASFLLIAAALLLALAF